MHNNHSHSTARPTMHHQHLLASSLFVAIPSADNVSIEPLLGLTDLEGVDLSRLIDCCYYMLREQDLSEAEVLRVWEIRLVLMLFNNQLVPAKREATNLNNAFYLHENPGTDPANSTQPSPKSQEGGMYSKQSSPSASSTSLTQSGLPQKVAVYPLPNNNDCRIPDSLVRLLLRLKSTPNLNLVTEFYKLSYQYRLRSSAGQGYDLQAKLICFAYAIASVLIINKDYISLLSLAESICGDLECVLKEVGSKSYEAYVSNMRMVWVWVKVLSFKNKAFPNIKSVRDISDTQVNMVAETCQPIFQEIDARTLTALKFVLTKLNKDSRELTLDSLIRSIYSDAISTRIICCTLSVWDIEATYQTTLSETELKVAFDAGSSPLDTTYATIVSQWGIYFNKLYGME